MRNTENPKGWLGTPYFSQGYFFPQQPLHAQLAFVQHTSGRCLGGWALGYYPKNPRAVQARLDGQRDLNSDASSRGLAGPYPALRLRDGAAARRNTYTV